MWCHGSNLGEMCTWQMPSPVFSLQSPSCVHADAPCVRKPSQTFLHIKRVLQNFELSPQPAGQNQIIFHKLRYKNSNLGLRCITMSI